MTLVAPAVDTVSAEPGRLEEIERHRLRSLHALRLAEAPRDGRFDVITTVCARALDVPIVLVTLVDEQRQWHLAAHGLDLQELSRQDSFCAETIQSEDAFIVEDARKDVRFRSNPLVTGPARVRFYAGVPLHGPGGYRVGALCVLDRGTRRLSSEQLVLLRRLADHLERSLALTGEPDRAADLQHRLLPAAAPRLPGFTFAAECQPSWDVAGDLYDWFPVGDGIGFAVADLMTKGVPGALTAAVLRGAIRTALQHPDLGEGVRQAALAVAADVRQGASFATVFCGVVSPDGLVRYVDAGHGLARVLRASGEHETLSVMGLPFGALSRPQWQVGTVQLDVGDTLLVVSDGLLDHFGGDRSALREVAQIAGRLPAEVVPGHLADLAAADGQLNDDVTVLAVSRSDAAMTDLIEVSERAAEAPPIANVAWRTALQRVIDEPSRLRFDWQPIIDLASARVAGFELLSRFHGPWSAGPEAWFTAAHWWGFSAALHERVLSAGVSARVGLPEDVFVSVNLDPRLVGSLDGLRFGLHGLVIELTGQSRLVPDRRTADALRRIRSLGGTLAVDDGGTGYGAAQIQALAPEFLKLARSAVDGVDSDPAKRAGVEAARRLIGGVGGRVVAEGIETEAQLDALLALGVPLGQGYLIGRPVAQPSLVVPPAVVDRIRAARGGPGGPRHRRV